MAPRKKGNKKGKNKKGQRNFGIEQIGPSNRADKKVNGNQNQHDEIKSSELDEFLLEQMLRDFEVDGANTKIDSFIQEKCTTEKDFEALAFLCCKIKGKEEVLRSLLQKNKISYFARNNDGTLLHAAVAAKQCDVAKWLLHSRFVKEDSMAMALHLLEESLEKCQQIRQFLGQGLDQPKRLFCQRSNQNQTALEMAILTNQPQMISVFSNFPFGPVWLDPEILSIVDHCCSVAGDHISSRLRNVIKSARVESIVDFVHDLDCLKQQIHAYEWQRGQLPNWNEADKLWFYKILRTVAKRGDKEILEWLLTELDLSVRPPLFFKWEGWTIADETALGSDFHSYLEEEAYSETTSLHSNFSEQSDPPENKFKEWLEDEVGSFYTWSKWSRYMRRVYRQSRNFQFNKLVLDNWNGKSSSSDLLENLKPFFSEDKIVDLNDTFSPKHILMEGDPLHKKKAKYRFYLALTDDGFEDRLAVLKLLSDRYSSDGIYCIPRLNVLVCAGELNILKWLISRDFVNLGALVGTTDTDNQEDSHSDQAHGDDCSICLSKKTNPYSLSCNHSFCETCVRELSTSFSVILEDNNNLSEAENSPPDDTNILTSFPCPLCRENTFLPIALTVSDRVWNDMKKYSWLKLEGNEQMTIAEALLGLAAGHGSVFILSWLVFEINVDPTTTLFQGQNVMHIAAGQGHVTVCKWLCANGYSKLVRQEDGNGRTPMHSAIDGERDSCCLVFSLFFELNALPEQWVDYAKESNNELIRTLADVEGAKSQASLIPEMLDSQASSEIIIDALKKSTLGRVFNQEELLVQILQQIISLERYDLLYWAVEYRRDKYWFPCKDLNGEDIDFIQFCLKAASTNSDNMEKMDSFIAGIKKSYALEHQLVQSLQHFDKLMMGGALLPTIQSTIDRQEEIFAQVPTELMKRFILGRIKTTSLSVLGEYFGHNYLLASFHQGHGHLIEWCLDKQSGEWKDATCVFKALQIAKNALQHTLRMVRPVVYWMERQNLSIMVAGGQKLFDSCGYEYDNILEVYVSHHATALVLTCATTRAAPLPNVDALLSIIEFLCSQPDVKAMVSTRWGSSLFLNYINVQYPETNSDDKKIASHILRVTKILFEAGADISSINFGNFDNSLIAVMISIGCPVFLKTIQWIMHTFKPDTQGIELGAATPSQPDAAMVSWYEKMQKQQQRSKKPTN